MSAPAEPASRFTIPRIETERLVLRGHTVADLDDSHSLWSDPEIVRYIGGRVATREEVWARVQRYVGHWALSGFGFWMVRDRATDAFIGEVGIADFQRTLDLSFNGAAEAGWVISPSAQGKGYALEAMRTVLAWAARHPAVQRRTVCMIEVGNEPSVRVATKLGYREHARTTYKGDPVVVYERTND